MNILAPLCVLSLIEPFESTVSNNRHGVVMNEQVGFQNDITGGPFSRISVEHAI